MNKKIYKDYLLIKIHKRPLLNFLNQLNIIIFINIYEYLFLKNFYWMISDLIYCQLLKNYKV